MLEISSVALQYWIEELMNIEVDGGINKDTIHRSANIAKKYLPDIDFIINEINSGKGYIEISNVPIDRTIPPPPSDGLPHPNKGHLSELCLLGITYTLGLNPFSYQEEKCGALVHDIAPITGNKKVFLAMVLSALISTPMVHILNAISARIRYLYCVWLIHHRQVHGLLLCKQHYPYSVHLRSMH
ncbi:hypothetical protein R3J29_04070 [Xylella fastidiosa subsp. multiplex]